MAVWGASGWEGTGRAEDEGGGEELGRETGGADEAEEGGWEGRCGGGGVGVCDDDYDVEQDAALL